MAAGNVLQFPACSDADPEPIRVRLELEAGTPADAGVLLQIVAAAVQDGAPFGRVELPAGRGNATFSTI